MGTHLSYGMLSEMLEPIIRPPHSLACQRSRLWISPTITVKKPWNLSLRNMRKRRKPSTRLGRISLRIIPSSWFCPKPSPTPLEFRVFPSLLIQYRIFAMSKTRPLPDLCCLPVMAVVQRILNTRLWLVWILRISMILWLCHISNWCRTRIIPTPSTRFGWKSTGRMLPLQCIRSSKACIWETLIIKNLVSHTYTRLIARSLWNIPVVSIVRLMWVTAKHIKVFLAWSTSNKIGSPRSSCS